MLRSFIKEIPTFLIIKVTIVSILVYLLHLNTSMNESTFKISDYRPSAENRTPIPLPVRSVGHYRISPQMVEKVMKKSFWELFWVIDGAGKFKVGRQEYIARAGDVFWYFPGDTHLMQAITERWEYRWLTFDGNSTLNWLKPLALSKRKYNAGRCPQKQFKQLRKHVSDPVIKAERTASVIGYEILLLATGMTQNTIQKEGNKASLAKQYLDQHFRDPKTSIDALAEQLDVHRSTLFRIFKTNFGLSPIQYLGQLRAQQALTLLRETSIPITEVALQTGFQDISYFSKVIKSITDFSPRQFRNNRG